MVKVNMLFEDTQGKTFGFQIQNEQGKIANYTYEYLLKTNRWNNLQFSNAVKDSRGFVRGLHCELPVKKLRFPIYHASHQGIQGKIQPISAKGRTTSDFGVGFYTGDTQEQGRQLIVDDVNGKLYTYGIDETGLNIFDFKKKDNLLWSLYVGYHRGYIDLKKFPKLKPIFKKLDTVDVLIGLIADDKMHSVFPSFLNSDITDKVLYEALKTVKYGNQIVLKSQKACNQLFMFNKVESLTDKQKIVVRRNKQKLLADIDKQVTVIKKTYRRQGRFFDEILEDYR